MYESVNRSGLLNSMLIRSAYISIYFMYKKHIEDSYARLVKHHPHLFCSGNILDIGANIGYTSFVFSRAIQEPFKIHAFEPEHRNIQFLKQSSLKYNFSNQLVSVPKAVGNMEGEIDLWENEAHNGDHRILTDEFKKQIQGQIKIQRIPIITIDNYVKKMGINFPISFIKIDVQGYELAVCQGMIETLTQNQTAVIGFEYCPSILDTLGFNPKELLQFFQERDYQFYILDNKNKIQPYDIEQGHVNLDKKKPHDYIDLICARRSLCT